MQLRQLEYAAAVAEQGSFTAAAAVMRVSQPSLSNGVAALERELGVRLFVRLGRRTTVTDAGRRVLDAARQTLDAAASVRAVAAAVAGRETGRLALVALPTLAADPLAPLLGAFRRRHPGITVRVHEPEEAADVEAQVRRGLAELALTDITTGGRGLVRIELFRQELVAVSPPGTEGGAALTAAELADLALVATPPGTSSRRLLDHALARTGRTIEPAVEIGHREALVPLVLAGAGTCLLPASTAAGAAAQGAVVRPLRPALGRRIGLLHRQGPLSPAAAAFCDVARARLRARGSRR